MYTIYKPIYMSAIKEEEMHAYIYILYISALGIVSLHGNKAP